MNEKGKGLWANIHDKRKKGKKPARKGSKAYNKAKAAADKLNNEELNHIKTLESFVGEARAYKLKASEFGQNTMSAPYAVKGENGTWRVHSTYAIDQVSGNDNKEERDVVFFEVFPYSNNIVIKIGGIHNIGKTNASTYGTNFATTVEEFKEDPSGIAEEASKFLTDADHLKWLNKNAKSEGQKIKWAMKDDYSSVIEDLVNRALGIKESVNEAVYIPSNIEEFAKRRGALPLVKKIARWAEKNDKQIVGGTAIGKNYDTLILDLRHHGGEIRVNLNTDKVTLNDMSIKDPRSFKKALKESVINENTYLDASNEFVKELEKSKILANNINVVVGPSQWGKPGELRFRDHVTLRAVGIETELYVIPRGSFTDFELYTDTGYESGREIKVGDAKTIIKAMKRYVNKMNESVINEAEKYDLNFKIGDTVDLLDDTWEIISTMKPNKKFKDPFTFQGEDMEQVPVYPPSTNKKAEGYKIVTVDGSPQYGFLYQYTGTNGKLYTKLAIVGVNESVNEGMDDVVFVIDDGNLDNKFLMTRSLSRNLDYQHDSGDQYYVLPKRDFDRLEDYADSHGYDTDSIYVIDESEELNEFHAGTEIGKWLADNGVPLWAAISLIVGLYVVPVVSIFGSNIFGLNANSWKDLYNDWKANRDFRKLDANKVTELAEEFRKNIDSLPGNKAKYFKSLIRKLEKSVGSDGEVDKRAADDVKTNIENYVKKNESVNEAKVKLPKKIVNHKDIPTWAGWVAQHSDGEWTWYESYPNVVNFKDGGGAWKQEESEGSQIYTGVKTDPKNWKEGPYRVRYDGDIVMESVNEDNRKHALLRVEPRNYEAMIDKLQDMNINHRRESDTVIKIYTDRISSKALYDLTHDVYVDKFVLKESVNEQHKTVAIEDSILQGIAEYLETTKGKLFKVINYDKRAAKDLSELAKHLKPILDNWDEYGKVEEKLTQTFGDYLKDLGERLHDGRMAALGTYVGGRDTLANRQTALHNLNLFSNYIKSLLKEYGKDKTKLTFMKESRNVMTLESFLNEELPTQEIDPNKFQNPYKSDKNFFKKGYKDDNVMDDVVKTRPVKIQASQLKPSQDAVYLGKALGMAIGGVEGGNLEAVISQDNRILDGHHRWAATIFNNPKARVGGVQAELKIGDLVPVLRQAGDALGNKRGLPPKGGDQNIFKATLDDVKDAIYDGKYMNPQFYNKDKAIAWFEEQGEKKIQSALNLLQRVGPPGGAPPRADMPKIEPEQVQQVAKKLQGGAIDVRAPYVKEELSHLTSLESFIDEKKPGPDPYMTNLSKDDEEDKEEQMKKQAAMDDDDPNAYKDMPGDKEAREKGDMEKSKHTSAYHKKFKKVKSLEEYSDNWAVIKEGYDVEAVAQNVVVALDTAAQFFPRYNPAEAEAEVKDVLKKYRKLQGKSIEKAAKDIRNSLEDRGLLSNDILQMDVEIIIMDNLNESNIHENLNKSDVAYQLAMDYSGNSKPKIVKLNKKEIHVKYGYKIPPEEPIKSILKIHPDIELTHAGWSNTPSGGGIHKFKINESVVNEEKDQTNDKSKIDGEGIETGLEKKADETGVPIGILRVIMRRGMAAWKSGHRPGTNSTQWGYARVNSFLTKGDGTWGKADKDMAKEVRDGGHDKKL